MFWIFKYVLANLRKALKIGRAEDSLSNFFYL